MELHERVEFVTAFTRLVTNAWLDEGGAARLEENPKAAAAEVGLTVPENGEVVVVHDREGAFGEGRSWIDAQIALWESGMDSGRFELHVPCTPQIDAIDLRESELVGAGPLRPPSCRCL